MGQHRVTAGLITLDNFEPVEERPPVFVGLEFFRQIIIVIQPLMPVIPELNGLFVYLYVSVLIRSCSMKGQDIFRDPNPGFCQICSYFSRPVLARAFSREECRQIFEQIPYYSLGNHLFKVWIIKITIL